MSLRASVRARLPIYRPPRPGTPLGPPVTLHDVVDAIHRHIDKTTRAPAMILLHPTDWRNVHREVLAVCQIRVSSAKVEGSGLSILDVSIVPDATIEYGKVSVQS